MNYIPKIEIIRKYGNKIGIKIINQLPKNKKIILIEDYFKKIRIHMINYGKISKRIWVYEFDKLGNYHGGYSHGGYSGI